MADGYDDDDDEELVTPWRGPTTTVTATPAAAATGLNAGCDDDDDEEPVGPPRVPAAATIATSQVKDDEDDDEEPVGPPRAPATTTVAAERVSDYDDDDEELVGPPPSARVPVPTVADDRDEPLLAAPPRTDTGASIPRESPKRQCSSTSDDRRIAVPVGQWHDARTGQVVEPLPFASAATSTATSMDVELIECPFPLAPERSAHEPACPCIKCQVERAYQRGRKDAGPVTFFMMDMPALEPPASFEEFNPHRVTPVPTPAPSPPAQPARPLPASASAPLPAAQPVQLARAPLPPNPAHQRRGAKRASSSSSVSHSSSGGGGGGGDDDGEEEDEDTEQKNSKPSQKTPGRRPAAAAAGRAATSAHERRAAREAMSASRAGYEESVPETVRAYTSADTSQPSASAAAWLDMIGIPPPKEAKQERLAFRAGMRRPYPIEPIRDGIRALVSTLPARSANVANCRNARPAFIIDAMRHDVAAHGPGAKECGMLGFNKSMDTGPCRGNPRKPADATRKVCHAHGSILKAICTLVMATVGTVRLLELPLDNPLVVDVLGALAELVHWFAARSVYSNRVFAEREIDTCTRFLVCSLVDEHAQKADVVLRSRTASK